MAADPATALSSDGLPLYAQAIVLLAGAVVAAPLFKKAQLGTVLGYLAVGLLLGPIFGVIADGESILHFAELGVVFLLFVIGLELKPSRLWAMKRDIFGMGALQVGVSALLIGLICLIFGYSWQLSVIIGCGLALSSTAFGLQILEDKRDMNRTYGKKAFSILLFQDLAIVPMLALIPILSPPALNTEGPTTLWWEAALIALVAVSGLILVGRYLLTPMFRVIANTGAREVMIAAALLVVLGSGALMQAAGLSMAMGAFLSGVLLAESNYRHELEANIEPFRGILLGLFFIAVGLSVDLTILKQNWLLILFAAPILMILKAFVIYGCVRLFGSGKAPALRVALLLPQGGEFAFVLFSAAGASMLMPRDIVSLTISIVTLTMVLTPLSVKLAEYIIERIKSDADLVETYEDAGGARVFFVGFGRFGQIISQVMMAEGLNITVIDKSAERIRNAAKFGFRVYYGDGQRLDVLRAAGAADADLIGICVNDRFATNRVLSLVKSEFPNAKVFVRSYDRAHTLELLDKGVDYQVRELNESALMMGREVLRTLGVEPERIRHVMRDVRLRDKARLELQKTGGIYAGSDIQFGRTLDPEPLRDPTKRSEALSSETEKLTEDAPVKESA